MSQENVETIRRLYAVWEQGAFPVPDDEIIEMLDPEIEWDASRRIFDPGVYHGYDGIREFAARLREVWESGRVEPLQFVPVGDEVVVAVRLVLVSRTDHQAVTANAAHVWTLRDGKIIRFCVFQSKAEALEAAGLSEYAKVGVKRTAWRPFGRPLALGDPAWEGLPNGPLTEEDTMRGIRKEAKCSAMSIGVRFLALGAVIAFAALAAPQVASAKKKTHTVDATLTLAIIESSPTVNDFAGRFTGKPFGTAGLVGEVALTSTPTGLITDGQTVIYAKKGTVNLEIRNAVEFQSDGSLTLNGTAKATGGTGKYKGATGTSTFNGVLPPGSSLTVGAVITFDVDGKLRY